MNFDRRTYKLGEEILTPFGRHQLCECFAKLVTAVSEGEISRSWCLDANEIWFLVEGRVVLYLLTSVLTYHSEFHRNKYPSCIQDGVSVCRLIPKSARTVLTNVHIETACCRLQ
jgi:hypothetical protein